MLFIETHRVLWYCITMNTLPDWAITESKLLVQDMRWTAARNIITEKLGWKPTAEMMYDALHDISPESKLTACGKQKRFINFNRGYVFCGSFTTCPCSVETAKITRSETNLKLYGAENFFISERFSKKSKQSCLERYGVTQYIKTDECKERIRKTCLERYGS
jgi:hypothetical protein